MLNLIKNEYSKLFHKKSTYFFLAAIVLFIIGISVFTKFSCNNNDDIYYSSIDQELQYATTETDEYRDDAYIEELKLAKSLDYTMQDIYDNSRWESNALSDYYSYLSSINSFDKDGSSDLVNSNEDREHYQKLCDTIVSSLKDNDWKSYIQLTADSINNDGHTKDGAKLLKDTYENYLKNDIDPDSNTQKYSLISNFSQYDISYSDLLSTKESGASYDETEFNTTESNYLIAKYQLENNTDSVIYKNPDSQMSSYEPYIYTGNAFLSLKRCINATIIIALILIILAGTTVSSEFSNGTIKFLLITPVKRYKIFWSKFITFLTYGFVLTLLSYVLSVLLTIILFGTGELSTPLLIVKNGSIIASSGLLHILSNFFMTFGAIMITAIIAFMLSALFRNSAIAIAIPIMIYLGSDMAVSIAQMLSLDFVRYTIFANMSFSNIVENSFTFFGMTPIFSVSVIAIHIFLFLFIAHDAFTRRNV
ncbi:MAG: ABC transporter permease [Eubacterium sp.]|nr:ABC transporter permease [Eubacterium sp.]